MDSIRIGLLGVGTVGAAVVRLLQENIKNITQHATRELVITRASVQHLQKKRLADIDQIQLTTDPMAIVNDPDIDIIIELMGGIKDSYRCVTAALKHRKPVITANKALIATHGNELFKLAQEMNVPFAFEASVAGGIPIIKVLQESLCSNQIQWIAGIMNGTGNYILSEMTEQNRDFSDVLREAQQLGYAEADPTLDIGGGDVSHKLAILASLAFGVPLALTQVAVEGIEQITPRDILYARELGYRIKQLGIAKREKNGFQLRVHPTLVPENCLLAHVNGVMNAILVNGHAVGSTLYYGPGAGGDATASAVVADLIEVARHVANPAHLHAIIPASSHDNLPFLPISTIQSAYYLRMNLSDQAGTLAEVTRILGKHHISIEALLQKEHASNHAFVPVIIKTHLVSEANMSAAINELENLSQLEGQVLRLRIEPLQ